MTVFSRTTRLIVICACLGVFFPAAAGADDDRLAGRAVSAPAKKEESKEAKGIAAEAKPKDTKPKQYAKGVGNLSRIESFGILTEPREGSLGIDMWDGSDRTAITGLIQQLPSTYTYKTTRSLTRRVLLTAADVTMLRHKEAPEAGHDLLSLRIQKLMEMGALDDAAQLYKDKLYDPYDAAMANTGELALLYSGQSSLACLETKALKERFKDDAFWQEMNGICDYLLGSMAKSKTAAAYTGNSAIIKQVLENSNFRFAVGSIQEFEKLSPLEKALLVADRRIDYSKLKRLDRATFTPSTLMLLAHDATAPVEFRFQLMLTAVREGIASPADLGTFYKAQTFARLADDSGRLEGIGDYKGWQRLAWLYKSAAAARGRINGPVLKAALLLQGEYGLEALEPFAFMLSDAKTEGMSDDSIRTGILLALAANLPVSDAWAQQWKKNDSNVKNDFLVRIAYGIVTDSLTENQANYKKLMNEISALPVQQQQLIKMLAEKLDKRSKLHNIGLGKVYENTVDLTQNVSYVMPSVGLMDSLATAVNDKHPGEVVLLSSIALHGVPPAKMFAGMLREVVGGFETVGLTKEARELAKEAILGLGK